MIVTLPVPLFAGKSEWHAVQLASPGALVCEGVGPLADAETLSKFDEVLLSARSAITEMLRMAIDFASRWRPDLLFIE